MSVPWLLLWKFRVSRVAWFPIQVKLRRNNSTPPTFASVVPPFHRPTSCPMKPYDARFFEQRFRNGFPCEISSGFFLEERQRPRRYLALTDNFVFTFLSIRETVRVIVHTDLTLGPFLVCCRLLASPKSVRGEQEVPCGRFEAAKRSIENDQGSDDDGNVDDHDDNDDDDDEVVEKGVAKLRKRQQRANGACSRLLLRAIENCIFICRRSSRTSQSSGTSSLALIANC